MIPTWTSKCGTVQLYLGDCLDVLPTLAPGSVDAVVADPPYGIGYVHSQCGTSGSYAGKKRGAQIRNAKPIQGDEKPFDPRPLLKYPNVVLWGADHFSQLLPHGRFLAWDKLGGKEAWDSFSDVEFAWHSKRGASRIISYVWKGLCQGAGEDKGSVRSHPMQKPVKVMRWSIEQSRCKQGESVLDPYMGSGTTGVAAVRLGRRLIGVELDPEYFEIAKRRIQDELDKVAFLEPPKRERQRTLLEAE